MKGPKTLTIQKLSPQAPAPHVLTALADPLTFDAGLEHTARLHARIGSDTHFLLLVGEFAFDPIDCDEFQFRYA